MECQEEPLRKKSIYLRRRDSPRRRDPRPGLDDPCACAVDDARTKGRRCSTPEAYSGLAVIAATPGVEAGVGR